MNAGVATFDAIGRLRISGLVPTDFNGGTPIRNGQLCVNRIDPIAAYVDGLPYTADGKLAVSLQPLSHFAPGGIPIATNGRVKIADLGAVIEQFGGLPTGPDGALAVTIL